MTTMWRIALCSLLLGSVSWAREHPPQDAAAGAGSEPTDAVHEDPAQNVEADTVRQAEEQDAGEAATNPHSLLCGYPLAMESDEVYHNDGVCDRARYNALKQTMGRHLTYQTYLAMPGGMAIVPDRKTVVCPRQVENLEFAAEGVPHAQGYDTVWLVENTSSGPVILTYVKDGIEKSITGVVPAYNDPHSILPPNRWKAVYSFDGHVFHARSWDANTNTMGPVLLQHRTGLIPIGQNAQDLECPLLDLEPVVENHVSEIFGRNRDPNFERTTPAALKRCNNIDLGFRNYANCPLNGYYVSRQSLEMGVCEERFKFHLGRNPLPDDFMWGWDSPTKFEGSFIGHSFVFRSAANPDVVVDSYTLQPTRVTDCPAPKVKNQINLVTSIGQADEVGSVVPLPDTTAELPLADIPYQQQVPPPLVVDAATQSAPQELIITLAGTSISAMAATNATTIPHVAMGNGTMAMGNGTVSTTDRQSWRRLARYAQQLGYGRSY